MFSIDIKINNRPKYCIKVQNVSEDGSEKIQDYKFVAYKVEEDREYHGEFEHVRENGLLECVSKAVEAIDKSETKYFVDCANETWKDIMKFQKKA